MIDENFFEIYPIDFPDYWLEMNPNIYEVYHKLLTTPRPQYGKLKGRRGFILDAPNSLYIPDTPRIHLYVQLLIQCRVENVLSLRDAIDRVLDFESKRDCPDVNPDTRLSPAGISKIFTVIEKDFGVATVVAATGKLREYKDLSSTQRAVQGDHRNLKSLPRQATTVNKKKKIQRDEIVEINKKIKLAEAEKRKLKSMVVRRAALLGVAGDPTKLVLGKNKRGEDTLVSENKLKNSDVDSDTPTLGKRRSQIFAPTQDLITKYNNGLSSGLDEHLLMEMYQQILLDSKKSGGKALGFLPTPRQYLFMSANEDIVLYGGAAGGGKSYSMVLDALRNVHIPHYKAVIIRKTVRELGQLIDNSRELYPIAFPGARFLSNDKVWKFPSGAQIFFGYLDNPSDKYLFQGHEYQYIGFDELSQHATEEGFRYLYTRARDPREKMKPSLRATANPGSLWVYEMFIKDREPMKAFIMPGTENNTRPITMKFIPAKLEDNPYLNNNGAYRSVLESGTELDVEQLLYGNWLIAVDNMFPEFNKDIHVVEPYDVPRHWNRTAGLDYGYRDPSAGVWFATNPETGAIVIYDEFLETGLTGKEFGQAIEKKEEWEDMAVDHPIDWSVFARTGHTGPTIAESMLQVQSLRLRPADKNREAGWVQIHEILRNDVRTDKPQVEIFSSCTKLIRQIQTAKVHPRKPNDLNDVRNKEGHWDLLDALRYGVMSRPKKQSRREMLNSFKQQNEWGKIDSYFSL